MITVFGSTNIDQIGVVSRLPRPGETVAGSTFAMAAGGKGANQALAARRAGSVVRHVTAIGDDSFAELALAELRAAGVDLTRARVTDGASGIAMILVDPEGENVIAVLPGANAQVSADDAVAAIEGMQPGDLLLLQQEIPHEATLAALEAARRRGIATMLNIAPFLPGTHEAAALADVLVANEMEFAQLIGDDAADLPEAIRRRAFDHRQTVVVTLGPRGVVASNGRELWHVPALRIEPVDTVGAGDTFCGYLADGTARGLSFDAALHRAATAASLACLKPGAQPAIPLAADVDTALAALQRHALKA